jgi:hypothetical protein
MNLLRKNINRNKLLFFYEVILIVTLVLYIRHTCKFKNIAMNKLILILINLFLLGSLYGQKGTVVIETKNNDTTKIILGKKQIKIIESDKGTDINVYKDTLADSDSSVVIKKSFPIKKHRDHFNGHWNAIEFGFNGYMDKNHSMSLSGDNYYMDLNTNPTRSINVNINFGEVNFGVIGKSAGFVSGLGLKYNNYAFDNNITIIKNSEGIIKCDSGYMNVHLDKTKLAICYFSIPLLFEIQLPKLSDSGKRPWISGGIIGSLKLSSHTKVVYTSNGDKKKEKNRDDFNLNALTYLFTVRGGYSNFYFYGNYSPVPLFQKNKGPELYPFDIGIGFSI